LGTDKCHTEATCINTDGNYTCTCKNGYEGDGFTCSGKAFFFFFFFYFGSIKLKKILIDVNECILGTHTCHTEANCINTVGNFTCVCNPGYSGNGFICDRNILSSPRLTYTIFSFS